MTANTRREFRGDNHQDPDCGSCYTNVHVSKLRAIHPEKSHSSVFVYKVKVNMETRVLKSKFLKQMLFWTGAWREQFGIAPKGNFLLFIQSSFIWVD